MKIVALISFLFLSAISSPNALATVKPTEDPNLKQENDQTKTAAEAVVSGAGCTTCEKYVAPGTFNEGPKVEPIALKAKGQAAPDSNINPTGK